jgi:hypothetical protein
MNVRFSRRRVIAGIVALVVIVQAARFVMPSVLFLVGVVLFTRKWLRQAVQGRNHLFFETDYHELLVACRELLRRMPSDEMSRQYRIHLGKRDPETLTFPQVILDLEPALVNVSRSNGGEVLIELFPGPEWFGVIACAEGSWGSEARGHVKLIDGLWYCDNGYRQEDPDSVKRIDAMVEEGRRRKETHPAAPTPQP